MKSKIEILNRVKNTLKESNEIYKEIKSKFKELEDEIIKEVEPMSYSEAKEFFNEFDKVSDFEFRFYPPKTKILDEKRCKELVDENGLIYFKELAGLKDCLSKEQLIGLDEDLMFNRKFNKWFLYQINVEDELHKKVIAFLCKKNILEPHLYIDCPECEDDAIEINEEFCNLYNEVKSLRGKEDTLSEKERLRLWELESKLEEETRFGCCDRELTEKEIEKGINDYKNYNLDYFDINKDKATKI